MYIFIKRGARGPQSHVVWCSRPFLYAPLHNKIKRSGDSKIIHLYKRNAIIDRK